MVKEIILFSSLLFINQTLCANPELAQRSYGLFLKLQRLESQEANSTCHYNLDKACMAIFMAIEDYRNIDYANARAMMTLASRYLGALSNKRCSELDLIMQYKLNIEELIAMTPLPL